MKRENSWQAVALNNVLVLSVKQLSAGYYVKSSAGHYINTNKINSGDIFLHLEKSWWHALYHVLPVPILGWWLNLCWSNMISLPLTITGLQPCWRRVRHKLKKTNHNCSKTKRKVFQTKQSSTFKFKFKFKSRLSVWQIKYLDICRTLQIIIADEFLCRIWAKTMYNRNLELTAEVVREQNMFRFCRR